MKNPLTPAGIEPATFRFVAQHFNHCATAVPPNILSVNTNNERMSRDKKLCKSQDKYGGPAKLTSL